VSAPTTGSFVSMIYPFSVGKHAPGKEESLPGADNPSAPLAYFVPRNAKAKARWKVRPNGISAQLPRPSTLFSKGDR